MKRRTVFFLLTLLALLCALGTAHAAPPEEISALCDVCGKDRNFDLTGYVMGDFSGLKGHIPVYKCVVCEQETELSGLGGPHTGNATCGEADGCTVCGGVYTLPHTLVKHEAKAPTCTEDGWREYNTCSQCSYSSYTQYTKIPAQHDLVHHDGQAATCTAIGWDAYDACSRCDYTTYRQLDALDHDFTLLKFDAAQHWYQCSRCEATTGHAAHSGGTATCTERAECAVCGQPHGDLPGHDLIRHAAQAATCTDIGWDAYDTCSRCDYSTYQPLDALGHDYVDEVVKPACEKDGYTVHVCSDCSDTYIDNETPGYSHWWGEWTPNGNETHGAACRHDECQYSNIVQCHIIAYQPTADGAFSARSLCPVCGYVAGDVTLPLVEDATASAVTETLPRGRLILRMGALSKGDSILTICFASAGIPVQPKGQLRISLPAALLEGSALRLLSIDGSQETLSCIIEGDNAVFTLYFADAQTPAVLIGLVPAA